MSTHGTAATNVSNQVNQVIVNQGRTPTPNSQSRTPEQNPVRPHTQQNSSVSSTTGTTGTTGSTTSGTPPTGDASGGSSSGGTPSSNETSTEQTAASSSQSKPTLDGLAIDDMASLSDKELEEKYKELAEQGFDVDEIKNKVETAKTTSERQAPQTSSGRENAGQVKGLMDDPDWGKPLEDKFDIQQGDFIEFLMKDVVLASASWTGNKVFGITGYALYKGGSSAYHWVGDMSKKGLDKYHEARKKSAENKRKNEEKINNENLYSGVLKNNDKTNDFAKKVLDARKEYLRHALDDPQLKSAQTLYTYVRSTVRGEMDIDGAVRGKDGKYTITRKYKDDNGKEKSQKITVSEEVYKTMASIHQNVQKTVGDRGDSPELRKAMEEHLLSRFENAADLLLKEKIFAADYAASVLIEKAARLSPEEIGKLNAGKEFQNLVSGEGKLAFYHHLYDIEHRKSSFKGDKDKTPLQEVSDTAHSALQESVKTLNSGQYREAFKTADKPVPENSALNKIFINGKSEYAPELEGMTDTQRETGLKDMQKDAFEGYQRTDKLIKEQEAIDKEISALSSEGKDNQNKKEELRQKQKQNINIHEAGTAERDKTRSAMLNNIRGNTK